MSSITYQQLLSFSGESGTSNSSRVRAIKYFAQNRSERTLLLEGDTKFNLSESITFNRQVELIGPDTSLGGDRPKFEISGISRGLYLAGGGLIREVSFSAAAATGSARTMVLCSGTTTFEFVTINVGGDNIGIDHINGGTLTVDNASFSDGVRGTAIRESSASGSPRLVVTNNQCHLNQSSKFIVGNSTPALQSLEIKHNVLDLGAQMLRVDKGGASVASIIGNTWYGTVKFGSSGVIQLNKGTYSNFSVLGNSFTCGVYSQDQAYRFVQVGTGVSGSPKVTVYGNLFEKNRSGYYAVQFKNSSKSNCQVKGNVIVNSSRSGNSGASHNGSSNAG